MMEHVKPNILWVLSDQQPAHMTSVAGNPNVRTPNFDLLTHGGAWFHQAVSGYPLCCPFRGSMLTSRYPHECVPGHEYRMPPEHKTVAHAFNDAGYHTGYFGKWHVDGFHERDGRAAMHIVPPERRGGFKQWAGYENNNAQWDSWVHGGEGETAFHYRLPGYETDCLTDLFLEYIDSRAAENVPFFGVLSVQPPHNPYMAPREYMARFRPADIQLRPNVPDCAAEQARRTLAGAYAQVENFDWNLGRVLTRLREQNLLENTHVIVFSDHGDMHGSHGQRLKILPWEESIRTPFVIGGMNQYDGRTGPVPSLINHVDIAPTSLGLCGIPVPDWMRGHDYAAVRKMRNGPLPAAPDSAYVQVCEARGESNKPWRGVVTADGWKYVCWPGCSWLLFNLDEDPYEQANRAYDSRYRAERRRLIDRLKQWVADTGDQFDIPED